MVAQSASVGCSVVFGAILLLAGGSASGGETPLFEFFGACDTQRVFEDGYALSAQRPKEVRVFGIRHEVLSVLYAAKRQAIAETLGLDQSPRVLFQTNPREHSVVVADCAVDVHGWAEPGTKIRINSRNVPVAPDGLFIAQVPPSSDGTIELEAEKEDRKMTAEREFELPR